MNIAELFHKDIHRNINGVIKVGQQDSENIRQELEEYVVTRELDKHFRTFFERYTTALGSPTDKMGVWISGFFGSGKSHFLKILSYLLANRQLGSSCALDYFDEKRIPDPMLLAKIQQAARSSCDVILFNIDSKADANNKNDKESITKVFQKVFDEHLGYFGTVPAIAEFERQLDRQGKYEAFQEAFLAETGMEWKENRDAWGFYQDAIALALQTSTGMSTEAANRLLDLGEHNYTLSPEKLAGMVKQYLESIGTKHHLVFMVDEVGQYIGEDSKLMLNLQTVVEDLGTHCQGRAWVVVTSQEAMDEITKNKIKGEDFSKIIGRFYRPLNLSSANTDEVIKLRLLGKTDAARTGLEALYNQKVAILKNQIAFTQDSADMPGYSNAQDFIAAYPFVPYQFNLLQKVFTQIRIMGSAGKHLASGERSLLDAFQVASQAVAGQPLGVLVPFHTFYMAVEGFLDGIISQVIIQAAQNPQLQPFDIDLLKTLFMVKYLKEIRANLDNLTTLSLSNIDQDKLALRQQVEAALGRLERQTLIQRNGDEYIFLTHEEQDIGREIKNTQVDSAKVLKELQQLVWDSIFTDKELRYSQRHRYPFNRKLDEQTFGQQTNDLTLHIVTPYAETYAAMQDDAFCIGITGSGYEVLVRLPDNQRLLDDLNTLVKTDEYLRLKNSSNLSPSIQRILISRGDENSKRRQELKVILEDLITRADVFAYGSKLEIRNRDAKNVLSEGLTYLVDNVYQKLRYVTSGFENEDQVSNALTRDSQEQDITGLPANAAAHSEMRGWLMDEARVHRQVSIRALVEKFSSRPYGWSELDTLGVMAELANKGVVELRHAQANVNLREKGLVTQMRSRKGMDQYTVRLADVIDPASLKIAKDMASDLLNGNLSSDPQVLFEFYKNALGERCKELEGWLTQAETGLPFAELLRTNLAILRELLANDGAAEFFRTFRQRRDEIEEHIEDVQKLRSFFKTQVNLFQQARNDLKALEPELRHISDPDLLKRVDSVKQILAMSDPTAKIPELAMLLKPVKERVQETLTNQIYQVQTKSQTMREKLAEYVTSAHQDVSAQLDLTSITQDIEQVVTFVPTSIDSAIARQSELDHILPQLLQKVDRQANEIIQRQSKNGSYSQATCVKPIVSVQVARVATKSLLETPQDVDVYVEALRKTLLDEIQQNHRVRLE
ncbi:BREX system P-loop protein BrxC [Nostoc spongiaeforme FACHB-130]|uniref:BREX system P-loop protein BrxC n=1 Tax=Nostoc spongiaeforme FACHB-130 TaxID=1357510 RepID=A0ABR8G3X9_9NOSO|nr:BREX system P-loop protein BrxC [Nostoc spongiaeforme]MBD2597906.1 BREX system P-loop protein BrxC [Nostoc spongiaeforme FACHB-130]